MFAHQPVLLDEVLDALRVSPGGRYGDGTIGLGGHAEAILERTAPDGTLVGCDRDDEALAQARRRLARFDGRFELHHGTFAELAVWVPAESLDGLLLDLGVSSPQLDRADRGFSFQQDGPLDMRMDRRQELTAADLVNRSPSGELDRWFRELGGERHAGRIARAIEHDRQFKPFGRTSELAGLIERVAPRGGSRIHPATRVFQALRIVVNDELNLLRAGLAACWRLLRKGGRLVVITFHSLEDRIVKEFGRRLERDYTFEGPVDLPELRKPACPQLRWTPRKAIQPRAEEIADNPRARSAQLRVMEKI